MESICNFSVIVIIWSGSVNFGLPQYEISGIFIKCFSCCIHTQVDWGIMTGGKNMPEKGLVCKNLKPESER